MRIANPLYDTAFKYLMENNKLAKKILSLIIEQDIVELFMQNQEHTYFDEQRELHFLRVDFKAIIRQPDGTRKKVLIELQKSKSEAEALRFRRYLGVNYSSPETEKDTDGNDIKVAYPIIAIYILGYKIEDLPYAAVTIRGAAVDSVTKEPLTIDSNFVNLLNHNLHILQTVRLGDQRRGRLDDFLNLFSKRWCTKDGFILDIQDVSPELRDIVDYLSIPLQDEKFLLDMHAEEEIELKFRNNERKLEEAVAEKDEALLLAEQERAEKEKERAEKEHERTEKESALKRESEALSKIRNLVIKLNSKGFSNDEIVDDTGLSLAEIRGILS